MCNNSSLFFFFSKIVPFGNNVQKYGAAGQITCDNIIRRMRTECWITKASEIHSEYVILKAFPRQQRLRERASVLRLYVYCPSLFINIKQLDALNFIISLFQASTCFEHMCSSSGGQNCDDTRDCIIKFLPS